MGSFLFLVLALAPFLAPSVVAATTSALAVRAHGREKGGGRRLPDAGSCALLAVPAAASALGAYGVGVMSGFYILGPEQMCAAAGAPGDHAVTRTAPPVGARCVTEQGIGTELVPDRVNPTVYGGITLGTLALGAAVFRGRRRTPH
ncbi:hypothetical protein [Streptomyces bottropensis]|uniref:hypothetical protein n=1 Tax=Streptomyces bottropensis TaxID=42235 RepID=UPI0036929574